MIKILKKKILMMEGIIKYLVIQIIQMKKNILKPIRMKKITLIILKKNSKNQLE